jgi:DNA-binding transcriptional ArsR family regulator
MPATTHLGTGWTALADPARRAIFEAIAERPQTVAEIAGNLAVSRPAVSQHLRC